MSTRCQIGFYDQKPHWRPSELEGYFLKPDTLIYQHQDGYPRSENADYRDKHGIIPELLPMLKDYHKYRGLNDPCHAGACALYHLMEQHRKNLDPDSVSYFGDNTKWSPQDWKEHRARWRENKYLGHCCDGEFHGDTAWYYAVYPIDRGGARMDVYTVNAYTDEMVIDCFDLHESVVIARRRQQRRAA